MTSTEIASASKVMLGTTEADAMYIGSTLIWQKSGGSQQEHDYSLDYLTIESLQDNNEIKNLIEEADTEFLIGGMIVQDVFKDHGKSNQKQNINGRENNFLDNVI